MNENIIEATNYNDVNRMFVLLRPDKTHAEIDEGVPFNPNIYGCSDLCSKCGIKPPLVVTCEKCLAIDWRKHHD